MAAPFATIGTALWIFIAYKFHQSLIDMVTGGREVTRQEEPRLYNLLENLCISRGITMPKLKIMEDGALNAFASGMNEKQYAVTVTTGLLNALDDAEIEAVLGHELTHIRNGDVRMLVIAVIIAGVISFFAEMFFRMFFYSRGWGRSSGDSDRGKGGAGIAIVISIALIAVAWFLSVVIRFALSRRREFLADAGAVELTEESRRHDLGAAQDREPRRARRRDLGRHGDVRRQSARGLPGPVRHASVGQFACRRAGPLRRRARSRPARGAAIRPSRSARRARERGADARFTTQPCRRGRTDRRARAASRSCRSVRRSSSARRSRSLPIPGHGGRMADRANSRRAFSHVPLAGALAAGLCAACSTDVGGYSVVTQDKYAIMACPDIINSRNALTAQEKNLSGLVEKAESAPGGIIAGFSAYRSELGETRMKLRLAQEAAVRQNCDAPKK